MLGCYDLQCTWSDACMLRHLYISSYHLYIWNITDHIFFTHCRLVLDWFGNQLNGLPNCLIGSGTAIAKCYRHVSSRRSYAELYTVTANTTNSIYEYADWLSDIWLICMVAFICRVRWTTDCRSHQTEIGLQFHCWWGLLGCFFVQEK